MPTCSDRFARSLQENLTSPKATNHFSVLWVFFVCTSFGILKLDLESANEVARMKSGRKFRNFRSTEERLERRGHHPKHRGRQASVTDTNMKASTDTTCIYVMFSVN